MRGAGGGCHVHGHHHRQPQSRPRHAVRRAGRQEFRRPRSRWTGTGEWRRCGVGQQGFTGERPIAAGAGRIDLGQLILTAEDKDTSVALKAGSIANGTHFSLSELRDDDDSFDLSQTPPIRVINSGDLIQLNVCANESDLGNNSGVAIAGAPRADLAFTLTPESGTSVKIALTTPNSYGLKTVVRLYPVEA